MSAVNNVKMRVCVIGAGAAGLCALRHLANDSTTFEPAAFEQSDRIGGTWVYNPNVGLDENNLPIHSSMYENLRTNLPSNIMNFPDWRTMGDGQRSCITHSEVLSYLENYAQAFNLRQYIQFKARIQNVRPDTKDGRTIWKVKITNLNTREEETREFDAVMTCTGHFFEGTIPDISGVGTFTGRTLHSHEYRRPDGFANKTIVVLGASSSGVDISLELAGVADHIYLSHNHPRITSELPENITQKTGVERIQGDSVFFKDGSSVNANVFIYCTGYNYSFPFLDASCGISIDQKYVRPLYRHLINVEYPSMCFIGIPSTIIPFPMFHVQVRYFLQVLKGRVVLPSKEVMLEDAKCKTTLKRHAHQLAEQQWDYNDRLASDGGFDPLPLMYRVGHTAWSALRRRNLMHYKEARLIVSDDGKNVQIISIE